MTKTITIQTWDRSSPIAWDVVSERFGVLDQKGREIGGNVHTCTCTWRIETQETADWAVERTITRRDGEVTYQWSPQATRDGRSYGAGHRWSHCATIEERDAAIAAYFASARKRAAKKAAI